MFGLTSNELQTIVDIIKTYPEIDEALIFGSRALDTHKRGSDIDIALKGKNLESIVSAISGILNDESPLPYFCDVLDYDLIQHEELRDHIDRVGKTIYLKTP